MQPDVGYVGSVPYYRKEKSSKDGNVTGYRISTSTDGSTLTEVATGTWTPDGLTLTFAWRRDGDPIPGETGRFHRATVADIGHRLSATVTATDGDGASLSVETAPTAPVVRASVAEVCGRRCIEDRLHVVHLGLAKSHDFDLEADARVAGRDRIGHGVANVVGIRLE